jgi:hypothetical protein
MMRILDDWVTGSQAYQIETCMWLTSRAVKAKRRRTLCVITLLLRYFAHRTVELTVRVPKKPVYRFGRSCESSFIYLQ